MAKNITYANAMSDAGLLRICLAKNFGDVFAYGGTGRSWKRAKRVAAQLSRMTGIGIDSVARTAASDWKVTNA